MKDHFVSEIQGHQVEFTRVSSTSFDNWYHLNTTVNNEEVRYRMHESEAGIWKIKTPRMLPFILGIERLCSEEIARNEIIHG